MSRVIFRFIPKKGIIVIKNLNAFEYRLYKDEIMRLSAKQYGDSVAKKKDSTPWCKQE